jgi:hypothetical protein
MYLQVLWKDNAQGKIIDVEKLILNAKNLFHTMFESKDFFVIRHIAADLRELSMYLGLEASFKKCFKNIDTDREDIASRIGLATMLVDYLGLIVHLNYVGSYNKAKEISNLLVKFEKEKIEIPENFEEYITPIKFNDIFEKFCITYILNFHAIFMEFLYNDTD